MSMVEFSGLLLFGFCVSDCWIWLCVCIVVYRVWNLVMVGIVGKVVGVDDGVVDS